MALALYRKYRPRTFAEVIGQEHVTEPLSQALRMGRLHHAYLFSGPRGCGKTSSARILARSLNCEKGPTPDPCGECDSCRSLAPDGPGSIDVIEIDAASHGGVDDARDLRERAFFAPASSRYKVYVIDEAHMVSSAGFNALLKLVEEPPEFVKFVFATTEPEKVLGTIKSRTHHYPFRLIAPGVLRPYLEELCTREGVAVEPAVFPLVVRAGGGSARDSLSVLDQLIAGAGDDGVTYARAAALLGVTDVALIDEMCDAIVAGDGAAAFATIDRVAEAGHDPRRFASDLLDRLRDLIILQQVPDAVEKGLLDAPTDQLERMALQAQHFGPAALSRCADIVHNGLVEMRGTTAPRLLLELVTARMLLPAADESDGGLLHRLERMERRIGMGGHGAVDAPPEPVGRPTAPAGRPPATGAATDSAAAPTPPPTPAAGSGAGAAAPATAAPATAAPAPTTAAPTTSTAAATAPTATAPTATAPTATATATVPGILDGAAVRRVWGEVLTMVGRKSKKVAAWVREATVRDVDGETVVLVFRYPFHAEALSASPEILLEALHEVLGGQWQIRCEIGGDQRDRPARPAPAPRTLPPSPPPASRAPTGSPATEDWPTPARPGGPAAEPPPDPSTVDKPATRKATRGRKQAASGTPGKAAEGAWRDAPDHDEPPFDPDYDAVVDEPTARRTSEQQALQLLQETLGAEKIGEVDHR